MLYDTIQYDTTLITYTDPDWYDMRWEDTVHEELIKTYNLPPATVWSCQNFDYITGGENKFIRLFGLYTNWNKFMDFIIAIIILYD